MPYPFGVLSPGEQADVPPNLLDKLFGGMIHGLTTLPKRLYGASEEMRAGGAYNPAPAVEAATLPMGTGAIAGVPLKAGEAAFGAGILRPKRPPPLMDTLHGTGSPHEFVDFTMPPATHDLGIHTTVAPSTAEAYAYPKGQPGDIDWWSGKEFGAPGSAETRLKPVLSDVQAALKFPQDAIKWNNPENVISTLEHAMRGGFKTPRGLLEDFYNIGGSQKTWQDQFIPMMQQKGYDSLFYPEARSSRPDTFMLFNEGQAVPKFSPEGVELARERGVYGHMDDPSRFTPWRTPPSILKKPDATETLTKDPTKNTFHWWDDNAPPTKIKSVFEGYQKADEEAAALFAKHQELATKATALYKDWKAGKLTKEEYQYAHGDLTGVPKEITAKQIADDAAYQAKNVPADPADYGFIKPSMMSDAEWAAQLNKKGGAANKGLLSKPPSVPGGAFDPSTNYGLGWGNKGTPSGSYDIWNPPSGSPGMIPFQDFKNGKLTKDQYLKIHEGLAAQGQLEKFGIAPLADIKPWVSGTPFSGVLNKSPKGGGMSPAGHLDKALNDLEDGLISYDQYEKIKMKYDPSYKPTGFDTQPVLKGKIKK